MGSKSVINVRQPKRQEGLNPPAAFVIMEGEKTKMTDFNSMYNKLFNAVTDAVNILQSAQADTEGLYVD